MGGESWIGVVSPTGDVVAVDNDDALMMIGERVKVTGQCDSLLYGDSCGSVVADVDDTSRGSCDVVVLCSLSVPVSTCCVDVGAWTMMVLVVVVVVEVMRRKRANGERDDYGCVDCWC